VVVVVLLLLLVVVGRMASPLGAEALRVEGVEEPA